MKPTQQKSPLSAGKKLFLGFALLVSIGFLYTNMTLISQPVPDHLLTRPNKSTASTHPNETAKTADDSLFFPIPRLNELLPDLEDLVNIPSINWGSF